MADSIQAVPPVNATITIQPVTTTAANQDGGNPNTGNPLANLANGTTVEGFVVNRDANNNPILRTAIGDLQVASEIFLKTGSEVTIKVDTSVPSLAKILSVDGLTPQDYSAQNIRGLTRDTITTQNLQPLLNTGTTQPTGTNLPAGAPVLQAIVLQPQELPAAPLLTATLANIQSGPASVLAQLSQLSAGTPIRLALLDMKLPPLPVSLNSLPESHALDSFLPPKPGMPGQVQQTIRQTEGQPQIGGYKPVVGQQPIVPAPQEIAAPEIFAGMEEKPAALPTGQQLQQQIMTAKIEKDSPEAQFIKSAIASPVQAAQQVATAKLAAQQMQEPLPSTGEKAPAPAHAPVTQPTAPNQLVANVIGHDADGANILQTPFASLKIYTPQPLPTGTTLLVQADLQATPATTAATATAAAPAAPQVQSVAQHLTGELSSFSDALNWLATNQPDIARDIQAKLPGLSNAMVSNMLSYIVGIRSGDLGEIIGKRAIRQLELSAPDLLVRLRQSVGQMQANYIDSPLPHWSVIPLPMWLGTELQQLQMYISKEPPENQQQRGQRFVLEVGLSQLGDMQFDGFVRDRTPAKSFDLMVRTAATLPDDVSQGIRDIFTNAMQVTGMQGQVIFQHGRQHFVRPLAEAPGATFEGGANTILA